MSHEPICRRVVYRGRVQGVGFRMTAARIARRFPVGGSVCNRTDGSVELIAAGPAPAVRDFLEAVKEAMRNYITDIEESDGPAGTPTDRFDILA